MKSKNYFKGINVIAASFLFCNISFAQQTNLQDTLPAFVKKLNQDISFFKKVKFTGIIIAEYQSIDSAAGANSTEFYKNSANVKNQFVLREARIKFTYKGNLSQYVSELDATERGVVIKDMYAKFTEPWLEAISFTAGHMYRPFGFEVSYPSIDRSSPERARMSQTIFPGERDLGAMLTIQAPKTYTLNFLKLEAGLFNGTGGANASGTNLEFDSHKDFIGHLSFTEISKNEKFNIGGGISYYNGGWRQSSVNTWSMSESSTGIAEFIKTVGSASSVNLITKREYEGADLQVNMDMSWGLLTLRGEYIQGTQPGTSSSTISPQAAPTTTISTPITSKFNILNSYGKDSTITIITTGSTNSTVAADVYNRNFNGGYFYFIQNIARTKLQVTVKYDWYDPNTKVSGKQIGATGSNLTAADIKYTTTGLGLVYQWDKNIKFTAYYAWVKNEKTLLKYYTHDAPDNVFTFSMAYKF